MKRLLLALVVLAAAFALLTYWMFLRTIDALQTTVHPAPNTEEAP